MTLYHFVCSVCGASDAERKLLADELERFCAPCFARGFHIHPLRRWPHVEGLTRLEAEQASEEQA
jgi:hypothetical protein